MQAGIVSLRIEQLSNPNALEQLRLRGLELDGILSTIYRTAARAYDLAWKEANHEGALPTPTAKQTQQQGFAPPMPSGNLTTAVAPAPEVQERPQVAGSTQPTKYFLYSDVAVLERKFQEGRGLVGITDPTELAQRRRERVMQYLDERALRNSQNKIIASGHEAPFVHSGSFARRDYKILSDSLSFAAQKHGYPLNIV